MCNRKRIFCSFVKNTDIETSNVKLQLVDVKICWSGKGILIEIFKKKRKHEKGSRVARNKSDIQTCSASGRTASFQQCWCMYFIFPLRYFVRIFFQNDPATLLKCLTIASEMMEGTTLDTIIPSLRTLTEVLVSELLIVQSLQKYGQ